jgi:MFS superfamily sulfate permease-like transporter
MQVRSLRGKSGRDRDLGTDRPVVAAVLLAVTTVLLLIGFAGPSGDIVLPEPAGWVYLGVVIIVAATVLVWLFCVDDNKRKRGNTSGLRMVKPRSKRLPLR